MQEMICSANGHSVFTVAYKGTALKNVKKKHGYPSRYEPESKPVVGSVHLIETRAAGNTMSPSTNSLSLKSNTKNC